MAKMGRPRADVDWEAFERLCGLPKVIENQEIAHIIGCDVTTCERYLKEKHGKDMTFAAFRRQKLGSFKTKLLQKQLEHAYKGNAALLIFLGKQYLNQTDKILVDDDPATMGINQNEERELENRVTLLIDSVNKRNKR